MKLEISRKNSLSYKSKNVFFTRVIILGVKRWQLRDQIDIVRYHWMERIHLLALEKLMMFVRKTLQSDLRKLIFARRPATGYITLLVYMRYE